MSYNNYQNIPIEKFIYIYDDPENVMESMNIQDVSIAEVISEDMKAISNEDSIKQLISKLRNENDEVKNDLSILENVSEVREEIIKKDS